MTKRRIPSSVGKGCDVICKLFPMPNAEAIHARIYLFERWEAAAGDYEPDRAPAICITLARGRACDNDLLPSIVVSRTVPCFIAEGTLDDR